MGIKRHILKYAIKLKAIITHKTTAIVVILWVYSGVVYYLEIVNPILTLRGLIVVFLLGAPMILAFVGTIELIVHRLMT